MPSRSISEVFSTVQPSQSTHKKLLRLPAVKERTGKSKTSIYTDETFPKPIKISSMASAWLESEVDAWIDAQIAARDSARE